MQAIEIQKNCSYAVKVVFVVEPAFRIFTIIIIIITIMIMIIKIPKDCSDVVKEVFVVKTVCSLQYYRGQKIIEEQLWSEPGDDDCDGDDHVDDHDHDKDDNKLGEDKM